MNSFPEKMNSIQNPAALSKSIEKADNPLISIIIPTYKSPDVLPRAIASVLAQTYRNIEIIVVDDGSEDKTEEVVKAIPDGRVRYVCHRENKGVSAARNTGLREARGAYIAFLDSDDEYLPDKLERQLKLLSGSPGCTGFVCCGLIHEYANGTRIIRNAPFLWAVILQQILVRRECFESVGMFDERFRAAGDTEMIYRLSRKYGYRKDKLPLFVYHDTESSISKERRSWIHHMHLFLDKHACSLSAKDRGYLLRQMGKEYMIMGKKHGNCKDMLKGYKTLILSFKSYPLCPNTILRMLRYTPVAVFNIFKSDWMV